MSLSKGEGERSSNTDPSVTTRTGVGAREQLRNTEDKRKSPLHILHLCFDDGGHRQQPHSLRTPNEGLARIRQWVICLVRGNSCAQGFLAIDDCGLPGTCAQFERARSSVGPKDERTAPVRWATVRVRTHRSLSEQRAHLFSMPVRPWTRHAVDFANTRILPINRANKTHFTGSVHLDTRVRVLPPASLPVSGGRCSEQLRGWATDSRGRAVWAAGASTLHISAAKVAAGCNGRRRATQQEVCSGRRPTGCCDSPRISRVPALRFDRLLICVYDPPCSVTCGDRSTIAIRNKPVTMQRANCCHGPRRCPAGRRPSSETLPILPWVPLSKWKSGRTWDGN